jgi:hypothetical protein
MRWYVCAVIGYVFSTICTMHIIDTAYVRVVCGKKTEPAFVQQTLNTVSDKQQIIAFLKQKKE